jgi:hypothetical protein
MTISVKGGEENDGREWGWLPQSDPVHIVCRRSGGLTQHKIPNGVDPAYFSFQRFDDPPL